MSKIYTKYVARYFYSSTISRYAKITLKNHITSFYDLKHSNSFFVKVCFLSYVIIVAAKERDLS